MSIERIVVKIGDKEVELTMDEARALWADLDELFSQKAGAEESFYDKIKPFLPPDNPCPVVPNYPIYPPPSAPWQPNQPYSPYGSPIVWCS